MLFLFAISKGIFRIHFLSIKIPSLVCGRALSTELMVVQFRFYDYEHTLYSLNRLNAEILAETKTKLKLN